MKEEGQQIMMTELGFGIKVIEAQESKGRWPDLTRLAARDPDKLHTCAWFLAHDVPVRDICEALKLSPCTVQRISDDPVHGVAVVTQKARVSSRMKLAFKLGIERMVEQAQAGKLTMFDLKMLWEMIQVQDGGATSRTEHVHTKEEEDYRAWMEQARATTSTMVLEAEKSPAVPALPSKASPVMLDAVLVNTNERTTDSQSDTAKS